MTFQRMVTFTCDRCGTTQDCATHKAPKGWFKIRGEQDYRTPETEFDLCFPCTNSFMSFMSLEEPYPRKGNLLHDHPAGVPSS